MPAYTRLLLEEIETRHADLQKKTVTSIYFGGGTPSLLPPADILAVLTAIHNAGFPFSPDIEITLEINPGTIDPKRLDVYRGARVNRFSVGVQTFNDDLLRRCGREHSAQDTRQTLELLQREKVNFSVDLLFGLPGQDMDILGEDLRQFVALNPPHVSAYCLTIPEGHPMNNGRAPDGEQAHMFDLIEEALAQVAVRRYEISNYARPGFESRHNQLYWTDQPYWGIGMSAHSYLPAANAPFGVRFWNAPSMSAYERDLQATKGPAPFYMHLPKSRAEVLAAHEALTDFCHTQLRQIRGMDWDQLRRKFQKSLPHIDNLVGDRVHEATKKGLVESRPDGVVALTALGRKLSNQSFLEFTFLSEDLDT
jgi:oxygen-independent coproporphyrinogen-3 oxidase